jgi:hypothetical protein
MKSGLRWLLLPVSALTLASCAASYGPGYYGSGYGYYGYGTYADYAYPSGVYSPLYGGAYVGRGWDHPWRSRWGGSHWNHHGWHGGPSHWRGGIGHGGWHGGTHSHGGGHHH